jgi:hypothetical protein
VCLDPAKAQKKPKDTLKNAEDATVSMWCADFNLDLLR